jgi:hypothetical protein
VSDINGCGGHNANVPQTPANQNSHEQMPLEAMQTDPWSAVYRPLPADADRTLLANVARVADQCGRAAFAAARVSQVVQPGLADYYWDRQADAHDRRDEVRQKLAGLGPEKVTALSQSLDSDDLQRKAVVGLLNMGNRRQRVEGVFWPEYLTPEALDKNPWAAAFSVLPDNVSPEFAEDVANIGLGLFKDGLAHRDASYTPEECVLLQRQTLFDRYFRQATTS